MLPPARRTRWMLLSVLAVSAAGAQQAGDARLVTTGQLTLADHAARYEIRHLPPASFPALPRAVADELTQRGCLIPQTYEARQPENVVHGNFEEAGSSDWAVLCSAGGEVKLLVFFGDAPDAPMMLGSAAETQRLQAYPGGAELGFNWGIDAATPDRVRQAQTGMKPRPARLDHDALADSVVEQRTIYHFFSQGEWAILDMPQ